MYYKIETVGDLIERLKTFPTDWKVMVATPAGGDLAVEHRDVGGKPVVGIYGSNGGKFGENPLTKDEYQKKSQDFLSRLKLPNIRYTSIHGDHRLYDVTLGNQASCYGRHYDRRIIEQMVKDGLIDASSVDLERVAYLDR